MPKTPDFYWDPTVESIDAIFSALWVQGDGTIGEYATLRQIVQTLSVDGDELWRASQQASCQSH
jgi:2-hydroxychromene-2-carboxylate isomerase